MVSGTIFQTLGDWDWVAIGTIVLAAATFALAWENRKLITASQAELEATQQDLDLTREQNATARAALEAQTAPYLANVPFGVDREPVGWDLTAGEPSRWADVARMSASVQEDANKVSVAGGSVPLRNVGNGLATIKHVVFLFRDVAPVAGRSDTPVVPPGERMRARFDIRDGDPAFKAVAAQLEAEQDFSVVVEYGDAGNSASGAIRLDVYHRGRLMRAWDVTQVHYGDTWEQAWKNPTASSQPM